MLMYFSCACEVIIEDNLYNFGIFHWVMCGNLTVKGIFKIKAISDSYKAAQYDTSLDNICSKFLRHIQMSVEGRLFISDLPK